MNERMTYIKGQDLGTVGTLVSVHTNQSLAALEETGLETDDNELHARALRGKRSQFVGKLKKVKIGRERWINESNNIPHDFSRS